MKKLTLKVFMSMLLICSGMIANAQMYGNWVVSATHHAYLLEFEDGLINYPPTELLSLSSNLDQFSFSGGGYDDEYQVKFFKLGE